MKFRLRVYEYLSLMYFITLSFFMFCSSIPSSSPVNRLEELVHDENTGCQQYHSLKGIDHRCQQE